LTTGSLAAILEIGGDPNIGLFLNYVKSSNIMLGLVTKIVIHFYTDFSS